MFAALVSEHVIWMLLRLLDMKCVVGIYFVVICKYSYNRKRIYVRLIVGQPNIQNCIPLYLVTYVDLIKAVLQKYINLNTSFLKNVLPKLLHKYSYITFILINYVHIR